MWPHLVTVVLGIWLLAAPDVLTYEGPPRVNDQIMGAWMATFGMIATSESVRVVRWVNMGLGTWLVIAPFIFGYPTGRTWGSIAIGLVAIGLARAGGNTSERFGGGWNALWKPPEGSGLGTPPQT